jgi:hypothetical protein
MERVQRARVRERDKAWVVVEFRVVGAKEEGALEAAKH